MTDAETRSGPVIGPDAMIGRTVTFRKTVSESDIYGFGGITGDLDPVHVDEIQAREAGLGGRIAHGVLTLGYTSAASSIVMQGTGLTAVSLGYDRVRFIRPVHIGDTLEVVYTVTEWIPEKSRLLAEISVTNQLDMVVAVAQHIHTILGMEASDDGDA